MLYFREHQWILINGRSRFSADIPVDAQNREDVWWNLELEYFAGGAIWRRVMYWERPSVSLTVGNFPAPAKWWTDLQNLNFWNPVRDEQDQEFDDLDFGMDAPSLDVFYYPTTDRSSGAWTLSDSCIWRVAARNGRWFTIELAAMVNENALQSAPALILTDGTSEQTEPDIEFWKANSQLYLVENVPFGTVNVCVPRNVRDPEAYAIKRAKTLVGVEEPEFLEIMDLRPKDESKQIESYHGDLHVRLHFNGRYED